MPPGYALTLLERRRNSLAIDLACLAYAEREEVYEELAPRPEVARLEWIEEPKHDTQGFMAEIGGELWVAIRGSSTRKDWAGNFKARMSHGIHRGFRMAAAGISSTVATWAQGRVGVNVTGHSRGGGIAQALPCLGAIRRGGRLYTFGAPRCLDHGWARLIEDGYHAVRWVNHLDGVPYVPPWHWGYRHVGHLMYLNRNGVLAVDREGFSAFDRLRGIPRALGDAELETAGDHGRELYRTLVQQAMASI